MKIRIGAADKVFLLTCQANTVKVVALSVGDITQEDSNSVTSKLSDKLRNRTQGAILDCEAGLRSCQTDT